MECYRSNFNCYFYGVVSSKQTDFNGSPYHGGINDAFGIDDMKNGIYLGKRKVSTHHDDAVKVKWNKPKLFQNVVFTLKMTADWKHKQCKLSIFYKEKKLNKTNDEYTLLLPELDDDYVVSMSNTIQ